MTCGYGSEWRIGVASPFDPSVDIACFTPIAGAVTTSSVRKRCWRAGGREYHHLLDPRTGQPAVTDVVAATNCSEAAWWSEVASKSAVLAGEGRALAVLDALGTPGAIVTTDARVLTTADRPAAEAVGGAGSERAGTGGAW